MNINENFYNDIFEKEKYWTELSNKKLLNIYYLNGPEGIKEFYLNKKKTLEQQYENNAITNQVLSIINNILFKIDRLTFDYRGGNEIDINSLTSLFLYNQMNTKVKDNNPEKVRLELQKQVLQSLSKPSKPLSNDEYAYDYLDEEPDYKGKVA